MPRSTNEERNQVVGMLRANTPVANVARTFNVTRDTIYRLMNRLQTSGSVQDGPRTGRPRATTPAHDWYIRVMYLRDRFRPATKTAREWPGRKTISAPTVRRRLRAQGLIPRRPTRRIRLLPRHRRVRLNWARLHRRWILRQWDNVMFTD
ncbi:uncharacterized protein LOC101854459 [Aplysia californica]|uniref:Uncharacterized protein LOC101854459 n=1 Tax=Aplysia californica TaxID=6500 RepID=A0ABM0JBE6_APLCA|nr:uncharacterized protein LOC101854459 [Aplysia californica]